ncbi:uncharacterized protein LOC114329719 [Diabrotica virgifera virgifera]|uniref:4-nitrophenylphosphatase-like n=1 Tax=Diabrotica virgifera virgifera TaxID=50390 RepID=A0A6P7FFA5_DIAVI|nr:uncharacterized protein LOC114329719 [Diabrotica virgifera virgifera]
MCVLKNLTEASKEEQVNYINSFDEVLLDVDGVIWLNFNPVQGAVDCVSNLKKLGKKIRYVTNNTLSLTQTIAKNLTDRHFVTNAEDVVTPKETTIAYLDQLNIKDKHIYIIGSIIMKETLRNAGYKLIPDPPVEIKEGLANTLSYYDDANVGAVIIDFDFNFNFIKVQKAFWYLNRPNTAFIMTLGDRLIPVGPKGPIISQYFAAHALKEVTNKEPILMGKPSDMCVNFIKESFNIKDCSRTLFVGDSIASDMAMGAKAGFQKLLVLSGISSIEDIRDWKHPEEYKPEYYISSLNDLNNIIKEHFSLT